MGGCEELWGSQPPLSAALQPPLTGLLGACCSLRRLTWELRRSLRSRGVWGRGKQLTGFLDCKRGDKGGVFREGPDPWDTATRRQKGSEQGPCAQP